MVTETLVFDWIVASATRHGYMPTIREIQAGTDLSRGSITYHLDNLIAKGKLRRRDGQSRGLSLVGYRFSLVKGPA